MQPPISTFYAGWEAYNQMIERALTGLDAEQLSLQAAPHLWSIRMMANHIVGARAWWFAAWMGEGGTQLAQLDEFDEGPESEIRTAAEIVDALQLSWSRIATSLASWTHDDLDKQFQRPVPNAAGERPWRTRQYIIWHVAEHDVYHGGEISLTLGIHGLPGLGL